MKTDLTPAMQRRLAKLAAAAGRTPAEILPYVMQDGFDYTEEFIRKVNEALDEVDSGDGIPHEVVMHEAQAIIDGPCRQAQKSGLSGARPHGWNSLKPSPITPT